jgi:hypothetical protein
MAVSIIHIPEIQQINLPEVWLTRSAVTARGSKPILSKISFSSL